MSMRLGLGLGIPYVGRRGGMASPSQQILTRSADDGWTAVYDPTNPDTRTLRVNGADSYASALADGMEHASDAVQATESKQPQLIVGGIGDLDTLRYVNASATLLQTAAWPDLGLAQPFFIMAVVKATENNTFVFVAEDTANRNSLWRTGNDMRFRSVTTDLTLVSGVDNNFHVYGLLFNNDASAGWVDKAQTVTGDLAGTDRLNQLTLGGRKDDTAHLTGEIAAWLAYPGIPADTIRDGMFDLLHDLTGIAKA